jgi:hypothetical protein
MTTAEAKELLLFHSGDHEVFGHRTWEDGFLGSLYPYSGLKKENLHEVIEALRVLAPELQQDKLDREIVNALWGICFFARYWGLDSDGMLRRNNLIETEDVKKLKNWVTAISFAIAMILDGHDVDETLKELDSDISRA